MDLPLKPKGHSKFYGKDNSKMTIKAKLIINATVVLAAISMIIISALISARTVDRNVKELTQKTAPYQLKALYQQRAFQTHAANLVNLSSSKTSDEYSKAASVVSESLANVKKASDDMAKLKGESSRDDKIITGITQNILDITDRNIKAQMAVAQVSQSTQERLSEVTKKLDAFVRSLQNKNSGTVVVGVDKLMAVNQQLNHLNIIRENIKEVSFNLTKIPGTNYKRDVVAMKNNMINKINITIQTIKNIKSLDYVTMKTTDYLTKDVTQKLTALNQNLSAPYGLIGMQIKYLTDEDSDLAEKIQTSAKDSGYELSYLMPTLDKAIEAAAKTVKANTENMAQDIGTFSSMNNILSVASGLSLMSASLQTKMSNCIYAKTEADFNQQVLAIEGLLKEAEGAGKKLQVQVGKMKQAAELKMINAFLNSLAVVKSDFFGSGGVSEKVLASIKNNEALVALNENMKNIAAKQLKESQAEVSQAGVNQENVVVSLNQASKRTMQIVFFVGLLIIIVTLLMAVIITRSITIPIRNVVDGLTSSAEQVASASGEVAAASQSLAEGSSEQAAGIEETSASIEEMTSMTKQSADNAHHANALMVDTSGIVDDANRTMNDLTKAMQEISQASAETAKIVKTIDEISFQTNLLALNAAVEAARAGEAGTGFAVVADEVRNLAMRAADAAKNTTTLIEGIVVKIQTGTVMVGKTNESFAKVASGAKKVGEIVSEMKAASDEQAQGIGQISNAIAEMDRVIQRNAANAEESASASEQMKAQAERLKEFVGQLTSLVGGDNGKDETHLPATRSAITT